MIKLFITLLVCFAPISLVSAANADIDKAIELYAERDYKRAFATIKGAADSKNPQAQGMLAILYLRGKGVEKNKKLGLKLLKKSAKANEVNAQRALCQMYASGTDVKKASPKDAFHWCDAAAAQDDMIALTELGIMYLNGVGAKSDEKKAFKLFLTAGRRNIPKAQTQLSVMYADGVMGKPNDVLSQIWAQRSAFNQKTFCDAYGWPCKLGDPLETCDLNWLGTHLDLALVLKEAIGGNTLLHCAAQGGDTNLTRDALGYGAIINVRNDDGRTPLMIAARYGNFKVVEALLESGAKVDIVANNNDQAIHDAVTGMDRAIIAALIKKGADINAIGKNSYTPNDIAHRLRYDFLYDFLWSKGAECAVSACK